ncbi:MAG: hypothetical protein V3U29_09950 [Phycisphaeraceae bacterium]
MRSTALWSTVLTAAAVMVGCAGTDEVQNYKVLEDKKPLFEPEDPSSPRSHVPLTVFIAASLDNSENTTVAEPLLQPVRGASAHAFDDRASWPKITVGPADGRTHHNPIYFRDVPIDDTYVDVTDPPSSLSQFDAALYGADARNWHLTNAVGLGLQPVKFGIDLFLLPVYVLTEGSGLYEGPPWAHRTTP